VDVDSLLAQARRDGVPKRYRRDFRGELVERWVLKTAINLFVVNGGDKIWETGAEATEPPPRFVSAAFGRARLDHPQGLYNWAGTALGDKISITRELRFTPVVRDTNVFVGGHFILAGLSFLIWLSDANVPWSKLNAFHRHLGGDLNDGPAAGTLHLSWPPGWKRSSACTLTR